MVQLCVLIAMVLAQLYTGDEIIALYYKKTILFYGNLKQFNIKNYKQVLPFFVVFETRFWNIAQARLRIPTSALDSPGPELPNLT